MRRHLRWHRTLRASMVKQKHLNTEMKSFTAAAPRFWHVNGNKHVCWHWKSKFGLLHAFFPRKAALLVLDISIALEFPHSVNPLQDTGDIRQVGPHMKSCGLISRIQKVPNQFVGPKTVEKQVWGALKHILVAKWASSFKRQQSWSWGYVLQWALSQREQQLSSVLLLVWSAETKWHTVQFSWWFLLACAMVGLAMYGWNWRKQCEM